ncbi:MAG: aldehyde ferredoxin oxidoreductase, partial [Deltaproteobacteria bacterium]|nr:aldehyde ferredoxin oxidoreductase [Deltaproteobacteria bacterium]
MFGWKGKILRVDLSRGETRVEDMPTYLMEDYVGGRGMGIRLLFDEIDPAADALGPGNKMVFATGPVTGTGMPAGSRFIVASKSPLSHCIANPCCGGYFG